MFNFLLGCFHFISFFFAHHYISHTTYHHFKGTPQPSIQITITPTITPSPIISEAPTITISDIPSVTVTPTEVPSDTPTATPTLSISSEPTATPTAEPTPTEEISPTATPSPTITLTPTPTASPTPTEVPTETIIPTNTLTPTEVPVDTPTATPSPTMTLMPTPTPTPSTSSVPTATPTITLSPSPTEDPTATPSPTVDPSITPTATPSPTVTLTPTPTATPTPTITKIGNDISYPQCNNSFPSGQGFGIVGINGGLASTTNPCLSTELLWAGQSLGTANQAKVQLYVNTGNPEDSISIIKTWPQNNIDPTGNNAPNPYGTCDGSVSTACVWQYGWNRAVDDILNRFIPAAQAAGVDATPSDYILWLDVETTNSWSSTALDRNRADLEAMVSYFQSQGIKVGIYSTNFQWGQIVGSVPSGSNLNGLLNWRPGASDLVGAQSNCSLSSLTSGGSISLTQYTLNNFDYDYSCL